MCTRRKQKLARPNINVNGAKRLKIQYQQKKKIAA